MSRLDGIAALLQRTDANLARVRGPAAPPPSSHDIGLEWQAFQKQWQKEKQDELGELRAFLILSDQKMTSLQNKYDETEKSLRSQVATACADMKRQTQQPQENVELRLLQNKIQMLDSEIKESRQPDFSIEEVKRGIAQVSSRVEILSGKFDMLQREKDLGAAEGFEWRLAQLEAHQKIQKETVLQEDSALVCLRRRLDHLELEVAQAQRSSEHAADRHDAMENRLRSDDVATELLKQKYSTLAEQIRTMTQTTHTRLTDVEQMQDNVWSQFNALKEHTMDMMTKLHEKTDFSPRKLGESLTEALQARISKVEDQLPGLHVQESLVETFEDYCRKVDALQMRFDSIEEAPITNPYPDTTNIIAREETGDQALSESGNFAPDQTQLTEVFGRLTALDREVEGLKSNAHFICLSEMKQQEIVASLQDKTEGAKEETTTNQATVQALVERLEQLETQLRSAEVLITAQDSNSASVVLQVTQLDAQIAKLHEEVGRVGEAAQKNIESLDDKVQELSCDVSKVNSDKWDDLEYRLGAIAEKTIRADNTPSAGDQMFENECLSPSRLGFFPDAKKVAKVELAIDQLVKDRERDMNTMNDKLDRAILDGAVEREAIAQRVQALEFGEITKSSVIAKSAAHIKDKLLSTSEHQLVGGDSPDATNVVAITPVDALERSIRDHASRITDLEAIYTTNVSLTGTPAIIKDECDPHAGTSTVQERIDIIEQRLDHLADSELRALADHVRDLKDQCAQVESRGATELAECAKRWEASARVVEDPARMKDATGDRDHMSTNPEQGDMSHIKHDVNTLGSMPDHINPDKTDNIAQRNLSAIVGTLEEQTSATLLQNKRISALEAFMNANCDVSPSLAALYERIGAVELACKQDRDNIAFGAADIETRFAKVEIAIPEMRQILADLSAGLDNSHEMKTVQNKIESYCKRMGKIEQELPELSRLRRRLDALSANTPSEERFLRIQEKLGLLAQENQTFRHRMQNFHTQLERAIENNPLEAEVEDRPTQQRVRFLEEEKEQLREDLFHVERRILQVEQSLLDVVAPPARPNHTDPAVVPELWKQILTGPSDTDSGFFERSEEDPKSGEGAGRHGATFFEGEDVSRKENASAQDDDDSNSVCSLFSPKSQEPVQESAKSICKVTEQSAPSLYEQQLTNSTVLPKRTIDTGIRTCSIALASPRSGSSRASSSRVYVAAPVPRPIRRQDLERRTPQAAQEHSIAGEGLSLASHPMSQREGDRPFGESTRHKPARDTSSRTSSIVSSPKEIPLAVSSSLSKHSLHGSTTESLSRASFQASSQKQTEATAPPSSFATRQTDAPTVCPDARDGFLAHTESLLSFAAHSEEVSASSLGAPHIAPSVSSLSPVSLGAPQLLDTRALPAAYFIPQEHRVGDSLSYHAVCGPTSASHDQSSDDDDPEKTRLITRQDADASLIAEIHQPVIPERKHSIEPHALSIRSNQSSGHSDRIGAPAGYPPRMSPTSSVTSSVAPCLHAGGSASSESPQNISIAKSSKIDSNHPNVSVCVDMSDSDDEVCEGERHTEHGSVHSDADYPSFVTEPLLSPIRFQPESSDDEDIGDLFARAK